MLRYIAFVCTLTCLFAGASSATAAKDWAAAAIQYRAEVETNPEAYGPRFNLARALAFSGQREEAISAYSELLESSPGNSDVLLGRGRVYAWEGRYAEAEADLTAATKQSPTYADTWSALGDMYRWSDRPGAAARVYSRWIDLRPDEPEPYIARGRARRAADKFTEAATDFEAARSRGADSDDIDSYLASLQRRRQNPGAEVPEGYHWSASLSGGITQFAPHRADWRDHGVTLRRYYRRGSLALDYLAANRFELSDDAYALDGYVDLWRGGYANLRYQHSEEAELYPGRAYRMEIFQSIRPGWELSLSHDHMNFGDNNVDLYGLGLGYYTGDWYLRGRTLFIPGGGRLDYSHSVLVRYYFSGTADDYTELRFGLSDNSRSCSLAYQKYFTPRWGLKISGSYSDEDNSYVERGVSVGPSTRW